MATLFESKGKYFIKFKDNSNVWRNKYIGFTKAAAKKGSRSKVLTKAQALEIKKFYDMKEFQKDCAFVSRSQNVPVDKLLDEALEKDFYRGRYKYNLSTQTKALYAEHVKFLKHWFDSIGIRFLKDLTIEHVKDFTFERKGIKGEMIQQDTLRNHQRDLFRFLRWADNHGYWDRARQLFQVPRVPKTKRVPKYLTMEKLHELFEKVDPFFLNAVRFMYYTGSRRSDVGFVKFEDYNSEAKKLTFTVNDGAKTKRPVTLAVIDEVVAIIEEQRKLNPKSEYVFTNKAGGRLTGNKLYLAIRAGFEAMNYKASSHILRHTFASQIASNGGGIKAIQELLRHAEISETMIYAHLTENAQKDALACLPR